jgi:chromosome segregation ATPase
VLLPRVSQLTDCVSLNCWGRYDFFFSATGLQDVLDNLRRVITDTKELQMIRSRIVAQADEMRQTLETRRSEHTDASALFSLRARMEDRRKELVWSHYRDAHEVTRECKETEEATEKEVGEHIKQRDTQKEAISAHALVVSRIEQELVTSRNRIEAGAAKLTELSRKAKEAKSRSKRKKKDIEELRQSTQDKSSDIQQLERDIEGMKRQAVDGADHENFERELEQAGMKRDASHQKHAELTSQLEAIKDQDAALTRAAQTYKQELRHLKQVQGTTIKKLQYVQSSSRESNARFGKDISQLMELVEANAEKFQHKPVGPVASFIRPTEQKWAVAAEVAIGSYALRTILVHSKADEHELDKLMSHLKLDKSKIFLCRMAIDEASYRDTGRLKTDRFPPSHLKNVLQVVSVAHPAVQNFLYDQEVYRNLVFDDANVAAKIAHSVEQPRNVNKCYDVDGTTYWRRGNSNSTRGLEFCQNLLTSDPSQQIKQRQLEVDRAKESLQQREEQWLEEQRQFLVDGKTLSEQRASTQELIESEAKKQGKLGRHIDELNEKLRNVQDELNEAKEQADEILSMLVAFSFFLISPVITMCANISLTPTVY